MLPSTAKLMSADDHIIEPPDLWVDRVPARTATTARGSSRSTVARRGSGRASSRTSPWVRAARCRVRRGRVPPAPGTARFDEIRPGCYDPDERIEDMDVDGVWGQLCFPNFARFAGHRFYLGVADTELGLACLQTYNDFLLDEWCATAPSGLFGAVDPPAARHRRRRRRAPTRDRQGCQGDRVLREPDGVGSAVGPHGALGSALGDRRRSQGPGVHAHRELVATGDDVGRRAGHRAGDPQRPELHDGGRRLADERGPRPLRGSQGHPLGGWGRLDPVHRGTGRQGVPRSPTPAEPGHRAVAKGGRRRASCSRSTCTCVWSTSTSRCVCSATSRSTTSCGKATTRTATGSGPHNHSYLETALADVPDADAVRSRRRTSAGSSEHERSGREPGIRLATERGPSGPVRSTESGQHRERSEHELRRARRREGRRALCTRSRRRPPRCWATGAPTWSRSFRPASPTR